MGGDHRTQDEGAHVRQPGDRRVRLGPTCRRARVSNEISITSARLCPYLS